MATHDITGPLGNPERILDLNRSHGDDYNNDLINLIQSKDNETFENGTNEYGDPILGSKVNDYLEHTAKAEPQSTSYVSRFATNFYNYMGKKYNEVSPSELAAYQSALDADPEGTLLFAGQAQVDLAEGLNPVEWAEWLKGKASKSDSFRSGRLFANYFYGKEELRERILKIHQVTGVNVDDLMSNPEAYEAMNRMVIQVEKLEKLPGFLKTDGKLDMDKVYKELPYLKKIQEKQGDTAAALALTHASGLKTINDVYHNEFTRFSASIGYGMYRGGMNLYKQVTMSKPMFRALFGGDGQLTEEEKNDIQWANNEVKNLPEFSYTTTGSAIGGMLGGAAEPE